MQPLNDYFLLAFWAASGCLDCVDLMPVRQVQPPRLHTNTSRGLDHRRSVAGIVARSGIINVFWFAMVMITLLCFAIYRELKMFKARSAFVIDKLRVIADELPAHFSAGFVFAQTSVAVR